MIRYKPRRRVNQLSDKRLLPVAAINIDAKLTYFRNISTSGLMKRSNASMCGMCPTFSSSTS